MAHTQSDSDTVSFLKQSAGKFPLLTGEQEIELGRQVKKMMEILELPLSQRPENWELILKQGQRAKSRMIQSNLRLVISIAKKYQNMGLPLEDLIQEGNIGLSRGVEKFDPELGYKASTYLFAWVKQGITRAIANKSRIIRLPVHIRERLRKIKQLNLTMMKTGQKLNSETVRAAMDLDENQWELMMMVTQDAVSYDITVSQETGETSLADLLPSELETPQERVEEMGKLDGLEQILCSMSKREALVLSLRYGLDRGEERSLAAVGRLMGLSRERVRQIEIKAMRHAKVVAERTLLSA